MYVLSVQYSCAVVSVFLFGGKANLVLLTLFYSNLLALTHRQKDGRRNKYTRFAWAGGTLFTVVLLCQFLVLTGNRFWFYILMYFKYNTVVVLCQFLVLAGNSFLCYVSTQCMIQLCGCVSFLVMAGNSSQNENTFLQKKSYWLTIL